MMKMQVSEVKAYGRYLDDVAEQLGGRVRPFVRDHACSTEGFTGLLSALDGAVHALRDAFGTTLDVGEERMHATADGVQACVRAAVREQQRATDALHDAGRR